jgi:putative solute:sodium symporter small subunit
VNANKKADSTAAFGELRRGRPVRRKEDIWRFSATVAQRRPFGRGAVAETDRTAYWNKTRSLMLVVLALWFIFSFVVHMFVVPLNSIVILGFPLGFYMAAQGSLIAFVIMLFWFARSQNQIDEEHGVAED